MSAIQFEPEFGRYLTKYHHVLHKLCSLALSLFEPAVELRCALGLISDILGKVEIEDIREFETDLIRKLRVVVSKYFRMDFECFGESIIPILRILDVMIQVWGPADIEDFFTGHEIAVLRPVKTRSPTVMERLRFLTQRSIASGEYAETYRTVYQGTLRVWNRIISLELKQFDDGEYLKSRAPELLSTLLDHLMEKSAPRLRLLFVLSNLMYFRRHAEEFLGYPEMIEMLLRLCEEFTYAEKDRCLTMYFRVLAHFPEPFVGLWINYRGFWEISLEFVMTISSSDSVLDFLRGLEAVLRTIGVGFVCDGDETNQCLIELCGSCDSVASELADKLLVVYYGKEE
jgi:hypothetical protein